MAGGRWIPPAFVGTGTGVGKTAAAAAFQRFLEPRHGFIPVIKPYVSGEENSRWSDLDAVRLPPAWWPPARYRLPLSPYGAVRRGEKLVPVAVVRRYLLQVRRDHPRFIVEGIGGVATPLEPALLWIDLHAEEGWPAVVVARGGLGTINHALLTIETLRRREIPIVGFILSIEVDGTREEAQENAEIIRDFTGIDSLGVVDYDAADPTGAWVAGGNWMKLEHDLGEH